MLSLVRTMLCGVHFKGFKDIRNAIKNWNAVIY